MRCNYAVQRACRRAEHSSGTLTAHVHEFLIEIKIGPRDKQCLWLRCPSSGQDKTKEILFRVLFKRMILWYYFFRLFVFRVRLQLGTGISVCRVAVQSNCQIVVRDFIPNPCSGVNSDSLLTRSYPAPWIALKSVVMLRFEYCRTSVLHTDWAPVETNQRVTISRYTVLKTPASLRAHHIHHTGCYTVSVIGIPPVFSPAAAFSIVKSHYCTVHTPSSVFTVRMERDRDDSVERAQQLEPLLWFVYSHHFINLNLWSQGFFHSSLFQPLEVAQVYRKWQKKRQRANLHSLLLASSSSPGPRCLF